MKHAILLLLVLQATFWVYTQAGLASGFLKYKEYAANMKEQIEKISTSAKETTNEVKEAVRAHTSKMNASFQKLKEKNSDEPVDPEEQRIAHQKLRNLMGFPPQIPIPNPNRAFKVEEEKQDVHSETEQKEETSNEQTEETKEDSNEDSSTIEQDIDAITDWVSQTSGALLSVLSKKDDLKSFLKNAIKESEFREELKKAHEEWKKHTGFELQHLTQVEKIHEVLNLDFSTQLEDAANLFDGLFDRGFESVHSATSETAQTIKHTFQNSATIAKSALKDLDKASKELVDETVNGVRAFLKGFQTEVEEKSEENKETNIENSEDQKVDLEVSVDIGIGVKGAQEVKQIEPETNKDENLHDCVSELTKAGALQIEVKPDHIDDFSLSCKTPSCKRCLLWLYVASQKAAKSA